MQGGDSFRLQEGRNACFARSAVPRRQNTEVDFLRRGILTDWVLGRQFLQLRVDVGAGGVLQQGLLLPIRLHRAVHHLHVDVDRVDSRDAVVDPGLY